MKYTLFFFLLLSLHSLKAQVTWAPDGAVWYYNYYSICSFGYTQVTVEGDTIIDGITCRKLRSASTVALACNQNPICCSEFIGEPNFVYADEDHLFHWNGIDFDTLYDFTLQVGDSYSVGANNLCPEGTLNVTNVGVVQINGFDLRYYDFDTDTDGFMTLTGRIIERIGVIQDGYLFPQSGCKLDSGGSSIFRCYSDPEFGAYTEMLNNACDFVVSADEVHNLKDVMIYPNPVADLLQVQSYAVIKEYNLYSSTGSFVLSGNIASLNKAIDLSACSPGIYIIEFLFENGTKKYNCLLKG